MNNKELKAETEVQQSDAAEVPTSSQTIAKPNVSCRIITGCIDCPFCDALDMSAGYKCNLVDSQNYGYIKEHGKKYLPITPDWCPVKNSGVVVKYGS